jgi:cobalt-zinc-cadmium efflux system protein
LHGKKILLIGLLNIFIVIAEIIFGIFSNSLALITDALHNLGDVLALGIAFLAAHYMSKEASSKMTFGFIRSEMMAAFVNSAFLCVTMIFVLFESVKRFLNPVSIEASQVIWVETIALVANAVSAYLLRGEHHHHHHDDHDHCEHGHHHEDLNVRAAYLHMLGDAAISLGVIVGAVASLYLKTPYIDPLLSLVFGAYILKSSYGVLRHSFDSLMDANKHGTHKIEDMLLEFDEIHSLHDVHMTSPSSKDRFFSAHVVLKEDLSLSMTEELLERIRERLKHSGITHSILQPETLKYANTHGYCCSH